jgi:hypothetical protein
LLACQIAREAASGFVVIIIAVAMKFKPYTASSTGWLTICDTSEPYYETGEVFLFFEVLMVEIE